MTLLEGNVGTITKFDDAYRQGYSFSNKYHYAFYDVYWQEVSGKHLILQRERIKNIFIGHYGVRGEPKPILGPFPVEILEGDVPKERVDQRCLEILIKHLDGRGLPYVMEK